MLSLRGKSIRAMREYLQKPYSHSYHLNAQDCLGQMFFAHDFLEAMHNHAFHKPSLYPAICEVVTGITREEMGQISHLNYYGRWDELNNLLNLMEIIE